MNEWPKHVLQRTAPAHSLCFHRLASLAPSRLSAQIASPFALAMIAEIRASHFRTFLARFARVCGIDAYGSQSCWCGAHHYSVTMTNSQQTGFGIRIEVASDDFSQPTEMEQYQL